MYTQGKTFYFLKGHDSIQHGDLCRPLHDVMSPWVEKLPMVDWRPVHDELPYWVGKTLDNFSNATNTDDYMYEIIRLT